MAIRVGPLTASRLVARKLGESRMAIVAAPTYLERRGIPETVADLARHDLISFNFVRSFDGWPVRANEASETLPIVGSVLAGDGESARRLALEGLGLARLALFHVGPDIDAGRLVPVLQDYNPGDTEEIHAIFIGSGGQLPARVRAFIDYLAETVRLTHA